MSIAITAIGVLVQVQALKKRWPGGVAAYAAATPNGTFRSDGHLAAIDFMTPNDCAAWVDGVLKQRGFVYDRDGRVVDVAVVDARQGPCTRCDWIEFRPDRGWGEARLVGAPSAPMAAPTGWSPDAKQHNYVDTDMAARVMRFVGLDGATARFVDERTGKTLYTGTTSPDALAGALHPRLEELQRRVDGLRDIVDAKGPSALTNAQRDLLLSVCEETARIGGLVTPLRVGALFLSGLSARMAGDFERAARGWKEFTKWKPDFIGGWMELTWCYSELGQRENALASARRAVELQPNDPGALANLAQALIELDHLDEAESHVSRSLSLAPRDPITARVRDRIARRRVELASSAR